MKENQAQTPKTRVRGTLLLGVAVLAIVAAGTLHGESSRDTRPTIVVLVGHWGTPNQEPSDRAVSRQHWKIKANIAANGTFGGEGTLRAGAERATGNVLGRFTGSELEARIFTDAGVQMAELHAHLTDSGVSGTFVTIGGDDGWFESDNAGFLRKLLAD